MPSAQGQEKGKVYRVAVLHLTSPTAPVDIFRMALRDLGWVEGPTLVIEYRGADGKSERLDRLAGEIVLSASFQAGPGPVRACTP